MREKDLRRRKLPQTTKDINMYIQATHKTPTRQGQKINTPHSTHS